MTEILPLPHGYKAVIETDDCPENPWKSWDGCTPILTFNLERYHGRLEDYGTGLDLRSIFWLVPVRCFGPKGRKQILDAMELLEQDCHRYLDQPYHRQNAEAWMNAIAEILPENPTSWSCARKFFQMLELLCGLAKIPCKWETSNGYSQGDSCLVFVAAMPDWKKQVGWHPEDESASLQTDIDLWSAWAWGDVYGYANLIRPDGSECDASCWGFYGSDHTESGLLENATNAAECDIRYLAKEATEAFDSACRGIITAA